MQKICKKCNSNFETKYKSNFCEDCKSKFTKHELYYYTNVQIKNCVKCNIEFEALPKQTLCISCRTENRQKTMVHSYEDVEQPVLCSNKECTTVVSTRTVKKSFKTLPTHRGRKLCPACKEVSKQVIKERMRNNNPSKTAFSKLDSFNWYTGNTDRMKINNPMHKKEIREKVSTTIKRKIASGELVVPRGIERNNFKGLRNFNAECRKSLYKPWVFKVLERDNFTCTNCGSTENLQVHHIRPLRDIIKSVFLKNGVPLTASTAIHRDTCSMFDELLIQVVEEHALEDGITYCKTCHELNDYYYRPNKGTKSENKKDRTNN